MELTVLKVKEQVQVAEGQFVLTVNCPSIARVAQPGQFVTIKVNQGYDPLIPRPFSIHSVHRKTGDLLFYYQVLGKTTKLMSALNAGDEISILGPLGQGFTLKPEYKKALLVGGGLGQAPLRFLAEELNNNDCLVYTALGAQNESGLRNILCFEDQCQEIHLATDDGSKGINGLVTLLLPPIIEEFKPDIIYTCGPKAMMEGVKQIALGAKIPCQVSLETTMACGIGVCLGCTCESSKEDFYPKVCTHGPVFWAEEVKLSERS